MKRPSLIDKPDRFKGQLRHYHRSGAKTNRSWDEWINGKSSKPRSNRWFNVLVIALAFLGLGVIIVALIYELR